MKKLFKYLLLIGCGAVLAACSKEEAPAGILMKAGQHHITLGVVESGATRVSYSHDEGAPGYQFSWTGEDAIGVYIEGRDEPVKYTVEDISDNGHKASFVLAEDFYVKPGEQSVSIVYPFFLSDFFLLPDPELKVDFGLDNMGDYTVLYATGVPMVDGEIRGAKLNHATSYLHFPAGFQFFTGEKTAEIAYSQNTVGELRNVCNAFGFKDGVLQPFDSPGYNEIWVEYGHINTTTEGKLGSDIYVPFFVPAEGQTVKLRWIMDVWKYDGVSFFEYDVEAGQAKTVKPGMVYEAQATTFPSKEITAWKSTNADSDDDE